MVTPVRVNGTADLGVPGGGADHRSRDTPHHVGNSARRPRRRAQTILGNCLWVIAQSRTSISINVVKRNTKGNLMSPMDRFLGCSRPSSRFSQGLGRRGRGSILGSTALAVGRIGIWRRRCRYASCANPGRARKAGQSGRLQLTIIRKQSSLPANAGDPSCTSACAIRFAARTFGALPGPERPPREACTGTWGAARSAVGAGIRSSTC